MGASTSKNVDETPSAFREFEPSERVSMDKRGFVRRLKTRPIFQLFCIAFLLTVIFYTFRNLGASPKKGGKVTNVKTYQSRLGQNTYFQSPAQPEQNRYEPLINPYEYYDFQTSTPGYFTSTESIWPDFLVNPLNIKEPNPPAIAHFEVPERVLQLRDVLYNDPDPDYSEFFSNLDRLVHLDLKGAPPRLSYLEKFFPLIKSFGATGLLIEYEDMFPYDGDLKMLPANNAFSKNEIAEILNLAQKNDLKVIPLVQTFGHMEFVLKYSEFVHLRETEHNPQVITPTEEDSYKLIFAMLKQMKDLHSSIEYIHLGCDEVFKLGSGKSSKLIEQQNMSKNKVFLNHVYRIAEYARTLGVQAIIWDDMLRGIDSETLKESGIGKVVQPMVWCYIPQPMSVLPNEIWTKYGENFEQIWAASAFKGATGSFRFMTNAFYHEQNHLNWIEIMKAFGGTNESLVNFRGMAMTGWQRYDHFAILCELIPVAVPSLGAAILALVNGGFNPKIHSKLSEQLVCNHSIPLRLPAVEAARNYGFILNRTENCKFPGSDVYYTMLNLWVVREKYDYSKGQLAGWVSDYNMKHKFSSPYILETLRGKLEVFKNNLTAIEKVLVSELSTIYETQTIEEWTEVNIKQYVAEIDIYLEKIKQLLIPTVWPKRPLIYIPSKEQAKEPKAPAVIQKNQSPPESQSKTVGETIKSPSDSQSKTVSQTNKSPPDSQSKTVSQTNQSPDLPSKKTVQTVDQSTDIQNKKPEVPPKQAIIDPKKDTAAEDLKKNPPVENTETIKVVKKSVPVEPVKEKVASSQAQNEPVVKKKN